MGVFLLDIGPLKRRFPFAFSLTSGPKRRTLDTRQTHIPKQANFQLPIPRVTLPFEGLANPSVGAGRPSRSLLAEVELMSVHDQIPTKVVQGQPGLPNKKGYSLYTPCMTMLVRRTSSF